MAKPNILITASTHREISFLPDKVQKEGDLYRIEIPDCVCYLHISGIGSALTAFSLGKLFQQQRFDRAYQLGIAGSFSDKFPIGSLVKISSDVFADLYLDDNGTPLFLHEAGFDSFNRFPFQKGILKSDEKPFLHIELPQVTAITVNTATGTAEKRDFWRKQFNPDIETMEGAAFYYACMMQLIPCMQIRAVSNMVGPRDTKSWNIPLAMQNLGDFFVTCILKEVIQ